MPSPTILQIVPELETGGAERTAVDVAERIVAEGWRAIVLSEGGRLVDELKSTGAEYREFPAKTKNPWRMWRNAAAIADLIEAEGVDIVHARSRAPAWSALIAARRTGRPFVTTYHGAYNQKSRLKGYYNSVMARGDVVIANSGYTADLIRSRHDVGDRRIVVIHRGTDMRAFQDPSVADRAEALRTEWAVPAGKRVILQLARLTGWKGQRVTIDALARLSERDDWVGVLAGDAQGREAYLNDLRTRIRDHGLEGRVLLPGHCTDVPAAMAFADTVVVASTEPEAFGRAAVEAQIAGRPVVVSDLGAVTETVLAPPAVGEDARTGWKVPPGDPQALAAALEEVLNLDPDRRASLAERARSHVATRFSLEAMTERTLDVYRGLLAER
ncbi:glycosyltransferase family 4 protein [Amorphus orientalis]|uniref:Glycosyltransferase involved in cell wall biosynthesis n=1 Tax=Amorphus orientalis TaxID=649198 RepID=A0AAE4AT48_9HYPH|nr:glycosyltransferase family 4 protein [Amorphus orientalis]MDQ0314654.1 glycosyltransferase involved in cell wall biosynthesis [Amorphus orientalis]